MLIKYLIIHFICIIIAFRYIECNYDEICALTPILKAFPRRMMFISAAIFAPFIAGILVRSGLRKLKSFLIYKIWLKLSYRIRLFILKFKSRNDSIEERGLMIGFFMLNEILKIKKRQDEIINTISDQAETN